MWLNELHVETGHRRKGIAKELIIFIEGWAKKNKIKYIAFTTGLKNKAAIKLYESSGYELSKVVWVDKKI